MTAMIRMKSPGTETGYSRNLKAAQNSSPIGAAPNRIFLLRVLTPYRIE